MIVKAKTAVQEIETSAGLELSPAAFTPIGVSYRDISGVEAPKAGQVLLYEVVCDSEQLSEMEASAAIEVL